MTAIEESKDLVEIKVQELISYLQTYELTLPSQRKSKSFALKTINERIEAQNSSEEDDVEKEVAFLAKNFRKFLKFKKDGKPFEKGKFPNFKKDKDFKRKDSKDSSPSQGITCFEYNKHGHLKKECPTYWKGKGRALATTLSDSNSSNSDSKESYDGEGNYSTFMAIAPVYFSEDLSTPKEELGEHTEVESIGARYESDDDEEECVYEETNRLQESYNALLEKSGDYARVAKAAIRKMKKVEEDYKSILTQYKESKCEVEGLNEELNNAYSKIKFLELEVVQANAKVERVASKKHDEVLAYSKPSSDRNGLGYIREGSSNSKMSKEMKFVKAKEAPTPLVDNVNLKSSQMW